MASENENEEKARSEAGEAEAAAERAKVAAELANSAAAEAQLAAKSADQCAEETRAADHVAGDASRDADSDAIRSSDPAVQQAARRARDAERRAHELTHEAKRTAHEAHRRADSALAAAKKGDVDKATGAAAEARRAATEAERLCHEAREAANAAVQAEREADRARLEAERGQMYGKERVTEDELREQLVEKRPALYLAEYESVEQCTHAAEKVRDAGYEHWDVHTPYPVHGMEQAMGLRSTPLGWISFVAGLTGVGLAVLMIQYMNNWDYPLIIGGKPPGSFPWMVPIMFELGILLTGFGTLFGLFHLARLPRHHHPIFESERFAAASDDRFFISIEVSDPKFDANKTRALLEETEPTHLELVEEEVP
ncbi:MAG: DUF3341 domain-containing protein [Myxococcota bacterium]